MNTAIKAKQIVTDYLAALSGHSKPRSVVERFVSDKGLMEHIAAVEEGFPCYELVAEQVVGEGDLVAVRGIFRGVHQGTFGGIEPTGERVEAPIFVMYRIFAGRIVEHWLQFDAAGLMTQLKTHQVA